MERRRVELEEKRRKLEEMKRAREERMAATAALRRPVPATPANDRYTRDISATSVRANRQQVDDLLDNILGQPVHGSASSASASRPGSALSGTYQNRLPSATYKNQATQNISETPLKDGTFLNPEQLEQRNTTLQ